MNVDTEWAKPNPGRPYTSEGQHSTAREPPRPPLDTVRRSRMCERIAV